MKPVILFIISTVFATKMGNAEKCWASMICNGSPIWKEIFLKDQNCQVEEAQFLPVKELEERAKQLSAEIYKLDQRLNEFQSPQQESSTTTEPSTTSKNMPESNTPVPPTDTTSTDQPCEFIFNDSICYWTELHGTSNINYRQAEELCSERDSTVAAMINGEVYNKTVEHLRKRKHGFNYEYAWINMQIDAETGEVINPQNGFTSWYPGRPILSEGNYTHVTIFLCCPYPNGGSEGMLNTSPNMIKQGVVCQKNL